MTTIDLQVDINPSFISYVLMDKFTRHIMQNWCRYLVDH